MKLWEFPSRLPVGRSIPRKYSWKLKAERWPESARTQQSSVLQRNRASRRADMHDWPCTEELLHYTGDAQTMRLRVSLRAALCLPWLTNCEAIEARLGR